MTDAAEPTPFDLFEGVRITFEDERRWKTDTADSLLRTGTVDADPITEGDITVVRVRIDGIGKGLYVNVKNIVSAEAPTGR